jgi:hypothetical protein
VHTEPPDPVNAVESSAAFDNHNGEHRVTLNAVAP